MTWSETMPGNEVMLDICMFSCSFVRMNVRQSVYNTVQYVDQILYTCSKTNSQLKINTYTDICWSYLHVHLYVRLSHFRARFVTRKPITQM